MYNNCSPDLDAEEDLLDGNSGPPVLLLVQDGETDGAAGVDVGVEEWGHELHLADAKVNMRKEVKDHLGWSGREIILEDDLALIESSLPRSALLARDAILPQHQVHRAVRVLHRPKRRRVRSLDFHVATPLPGDESKGMILAPALPLLREPGLSDARHPGCSERV